MNTHEFVKKYAHGCSIEGQQMEKDIDAMIAEKTAELVAALEDAKETIRVWHDGESHRFLTEAEQARMWKLYQESPEMKRINAVLAKHQEPK